jgi:hypothetical protein
MDIEDEKLPISPSKPSTSRKGRRSGKDLDVDVDVDDSDLQPHASNTSL